MPDHLHAGGFLRDHLRRRPDKIAVVFRETRLTFRELGERVARIAGALREIGVRKGDKIALVLPNSLELLDLYWSAMTVGIVVVPLSPLLRGAALATLIRDSDAIAVVACLATAGEIDAVRHELPNVPVDRFIIADARGNERDGWRGYDALAVSGPTTLPRVEIDGGDPFNIVYSSGTTGLPKGIVHPHRVRSIYATTCAITYRMTRESILVQCGSMVFNGAFLLFMASALLGATVVVHAKFDADAFIDDVERERATHVMLVPSQIVAILRSPRFSAERLASLVVILSLGAPLLQEHRDDLERRLPGRLFELYGLTEGFSTTQSNADLATHRGSVGAPGAFAEMRIVGDDGRGCAVGEVGEIVGRGPMLMSGYYKRPDLTAQAIRDGWLYSGDMGYVDDDGYLYLVDRKKDMIISGGVNVYPRDIEEVAIRHDAIREVAVFGVSDAKWGESSVAAVIRRDGARESAEELRAWINANVAAKYQQVREVVLVEEFPRNVAGKTLKRELREFYAAGSEHHVAE